MDFFIADTHFDHTNIIKYCDRPFDDAAEMNAFILGKWNKLVNSEDTVYFLGDLTFGRGRRPHSYWLAQLNGHKIFIKGSHDTKDMMRDMPCEVYTSAVLALPPLGDVLLIHSPHSVIWDGWMIHGHVHNNKPFVDVNSKRINVSVEATYYCPVSLDSILGAVKTGRR